MRAEFRVLGPLEVRLDGRSVPVPAGQARVVLATLLLRANRLVSVDELIDRLWDGSPPNPDRAKTTLQMVVTRLRQALGEANCVRTVTGGYLAEVTSDQLDLLRFRESGDVALWAGPPLGNVSSELLHRDDVPPLLEERLVALGNRVDADLERGLAGELVPELRALTKEHPLREGFWRQLMLALYRSGQQADALAAYRRISDHLADELGVDPGPGLRELHQRILTADESLLAAERHVPSAASTVPRQLPPAIATFVGRDDDLRCLDESPAQVVVISGSGGVGKTALAVHWAHRIRDRFPDGQIFVNLRGQDPRQALTATEVLARVLHGLGVGAADVPMQLDEQIAMYRSLIAERAVLLVLDNAAGPEQVRPLVPSSSESRLLVTSRGDLRGLLVLNDAQLVPLTTLGPDDAVGILVRILGHERVAAERDAARELVRLCAGLPLALRIAVADLAMRPGTAIADKVAALSTGDRLSELAVPGDPEAAVAVVFAQSYTVLAEDCQLVFRRVGLSPGADFTAFDAAVLSGLPADRTQEVLDLLVGAHLVERVADTRFALHDLLRIYANDTCTQEDSEEERDAAIDRLCDWYLRMTDDAVRILYADQLRLPVTPGPALLPGRVPREPGEAFSWLHAEHVNLVSAVTAAANDGGHRFASQLGSLLHPFYFHIRDNIRWSSLCEVRMRAAEAWGDPAALVAAWNSMCVYHYWRGDYAEAESAATKVLELCAAVEDRRWEAQTLNNLAAIVQVRGALDLALAYFHKALAVNEEIGSVVGRAKVLHNLATLAWDSGELRDALAKLKEATALHNSGGFLEAESFDHMSLSAVHLELGDFDAAVRHYELYADIQHRMGSARLDPTAVSNLIWVKLHRGQLDEAYDAALDALVEAQATLGRVEECVCWDMLAEIASATGEYQDALDRSLIDLELSSEQAYARGQVRAMLQLARAHRNLGDLHNARRCLAEARVLIERDGQRLREGQELTERAQLHLADGSIDEALRCALDAVETHQRTGQRYREAMSLVVLAEVRRAAGDPELAHECEKQAAELFAACGVAVREPDRPT
ncbi:SARP family transcriptional regulator [Lentzea sp. NBRC 105346]|uniref:AfsR/SARP family transcriptional regulator n=1 Tax=Lentzea sp. NBRC 105346 TaxID=3032205 RepID=UPI0025548218|nr:BTAD domain-containing putative transcriptional regulator [Lentzea sp. NBRC 105346]GLZ30482.1 SARP family transcriptional regulator [Lentzea sp. NBRC 105346]